MEEMVNFDLEDLANILKIDDYYQPETTKYKVNPYLIKCDLHDDYAFYFFYQIICQEKVHLISYYLFLYKKKQDIAEKVWIDIYFELQKSPDILHQLDETHTSAIHNGTEIILQFDSHCMYWSVAGMGSCDNFSIDFAIPYRGVSRITFATRH
jgi:hypothetical protein